MIQQATWVVLSHQPIPETIWYPITIGILAVLGCIAVAIEEVLK